MLCVAQKRSKPTNRLEDFNISDKTRAKLEARGIKTLFPIQVSGQAGEQTDIHGYMRGHITRRLELCKRGVCEDLFGGGFPQLT